MKIAIVTDSLIQFGGTERVLQSLLKIYPDGHVYTSLTDQNIITNFFSSITKKQLFLLPIQRFSRFFEKHTSILQLLAPLLWKSFNFEEYDVVFSSSSSMMCNLIKVNKPIHIQYINCIPKNLFGLFPKKRLQKIIPYTNLLKYYYKRALESSSYIISNSKYTQKLIYELCKVPSIVIYPPVRIPRVLQKYKRGKYFLIISRIDRDKHLEIAIDACSRLKLPLKIVGDGLDLKYKNYLKSISGPSIEFLCPVSDKESKRIERLYNSASALISTPKTDAFGIVPVEAMSHGVPVIAYYGGGLKETILNKKTGIFFYEHTAESLINVLKSFSPDLFDPKYLHIYSMKFSEERFINEVTKYISSCINE